jgi:hypothetical protein
MKSNITADLEKQRLFIKKLYFQGKGKSNTAPLVLNLLNYAILND